MSGDGTDAISGHSAEDWHDNFIRQVPAIKCGTRVCAERFEKYICNASYVDSLPTRNTRKENCASYTD